MATAYIAIARRSPCVTPSCDNIYSPSINNRICCLYVLINTFDSAGQRFLMLINAFWWFKQLKALVASTKITPSASLSSNTWCIAWAAASQPDKCPEHVCNGPVASWISWLRTLAIALPMIRRATSPVPIGRTPGHLSSATRRQATNSFRPDGSTRVVQIRLATIDKAWHKSVEHDLNDVFLINSSSIPSYITGTDILILCPQ